MEILRRPREVPEERHLLVDVRVTLVPSGEQAGEQVLKLKAKASETKWKPMWIFLSLWKASHWRSFQKCYSATCMALKCVKKAKEDSWQFCSIGLNSFSPCPSWALCLPMCITFVRTKVSILRITSCSWDYKNWSFQILAQILSSFPNKGTKDALIFKLFKKDFVPKNCLE